MRRYETLFIVTPDISEEELKAVATKVHGVVTDMNGLVAAYDEQGKKKLAYSVKKQNKGYYVLMDYVGSADLVAELERNMGLDDRILKYLTVKLADQVDPESIEAIELKPEAKVEPAAVLAVEEAQPEAKVEPAAVLAVEEAQPDAKDEPAEVPEAEEAQPEPKDEPAEVPEVEEAQPDAKDEPAEVPEAEEAQVEAKDEPAEVPEVEEAQPEAKDESAEVPEPEEAQPPEAQDSKEEKS